MKMTDEQRYSAVLKELGELLTSKNLTIRCQGWQIDELKAKLAVAEKERDEMAAKNASEKVVLLDSDAVGILREINAELRACYEDLAGEIGIIKKLEELQGAIKFVLPIEGGAA